MNGSFSNIYKKARVNAGFKREPVAEELHIDVRTLDKYESVDNKPPDDIVRKMCVLYGNKYLAYEHLKKGVLGEFLPDVEKSNFQCSTLSMINDFNHFKDELSKIIEIASDGKVNDWEKEDWAKACKKIKSLAGSLMSVVLSDKGGNK